MKTNGISTTAVKEKKLRQPRRKHQVLDNMDEYMKKYVDTGRPTTEHIQIAARHILGDFVPNYARVWQQEQLEWCFQEEGKRPRRGRDFMLGYELGVEAMIVRHKIEEEVIPE